MRRRWCSTAVREAYRRSLPKTDTRDCRFLSDNTTPMLPEVRAGIIEADTLPPAVPYGHDPLSLAAVEVVREAVCDTSLLVQFVPTGTAANVLGIAALCGGSGVNSVVLSAEAHVHVNTAGALQHGIGCMALPAPADEATGLVSPDAFAAVLADARSDVVFRSNPAVVSISQPTEKGAVYTLEHIKEIRKVIDAYGVKLHIDGARLANAVVALGEGSLREMVALSDAVSIGGAKNGMQSAEVLVVRPPQQPAGHPPPDAVIGAMAKRMLLSPSKMRYMAAQVIPYFANGAWLHHAAHANAMARDLASLVGPDKLAAPVHTNQVFLRLAQDHPVLGKYSLYPWGSGVHRAITSWSTSHSDVTSLAAAIVA